MKDYGQSSQLGSQTAGNNQPISSNSCTNERSRIHRQALIDGGHISLLFKIDGYGQR